MSFFYEIRSTTDTVLKRTGGFPDREAATVAAREDAKRLKAGLWLNPAGPSKVIGFRGRVVAVAH